ncbi:MAG: putative signal transducing protein [Bacteroidota bacterium]
MNNWQKIFSTRVYAEAAIIKGMLEENQIPVQILNKQDSSYPMFGDIQIFVPAHLQATAKELIDKTLLN